MLYVVLPTVHIVSVCVCVCFSFFLYRRNTVGLRLSMSQLLHRARKFSLCPDLCQHLCIPLIWFSFFNFIKWCTAIHTNVDWKELGKCLYCWNMFIKKTLLKTTCSNCLIFLIWKSSWVYLRFMILCWSHISINKPCF